jgi:hypothetical protein
VKISPVVRANLSWWFHFLPIWNRSLKIQSDSNRRRFAFTSDASDIACGGAITDQALVHLWSPHQHSWHINIKELWSVYRYLYSWSPEFSRATIMIGCDNLTVVAWLNNGCAHSPLAMKFLRKIFWLCAKFDFHLMALWIPTKTNTMADAISRLNFACFHLCSGIPPSGVSGIALSPPHPSPSLLSPHANSSEFRNLLKWLRTSSLPKQETSYWPLMHDPCNNLEWPHGRFLFGFALPTPTTPDPLLNESLSASPPSYTSRVTPPPPSSLTWPVSLPSMPPWVFRLVSRDWNAPCFTSFDKDYVASLFQLKAPRRASIFPCSANFCAPWTCQMAATWLSGQPSWLVLFLPPCIQPCSKKCSGP